MAASVVIYLLPVVAILFGAVALHEQISLNAILGVLVVLAVVAAARRKTANTPAAEPTSSARLE